MTNYEHSFKSPVKIDRDRGKMPYNNYLVHSREHFTPTTLLKPQEPRFEKDCLMAYANNKVADQPAHPRILISAFVICCLGGIITKMAISKIS